MERRRQGGISVPATAGQDDTGGVALEAALAATCDHLRRGIFLLDAERNLLFMNASARQVLAAGDAVVAVDGRLALRRDEPMGRLGEYLARQSRKRRPGRTESIALRLERESGLPAYCMLVTRLEAAAIDSARALFLCMVFDPHAARRVPPELLIELYDLSPAEAAVASDLFTGLGVDALARARGLSQCTVRTHLRNIFRKCEVDSQARLLQLLSLGPGVN